MIRRLSFAILLLLVSLLALRQAQPVSAHSLLVRSDPPEHARLLEAPREVAGWFSELLAPDVSTLRVTDRAGARVDLGQTVFDPADQTKMSVQLQQDVGPGFYLVAWETLSSVDGHIRFGSFRFTVLNPDGSEPSGPQPAAGVTGSRTDGDELPRTVTKATSLIAASVLAGSLTFVLLVLRGAANTIATQWRETVLVAGRRTLRLIGLAAIGALLFAGIAELLLQLRQTSSASGLLSTAWAGRWFAQQATLLPLAAAVWFGTSATSTQRGISRAALWAALLLAFGYLLAVSMVSHGAALRAGSFWATASDFLHLAAATVWVGGLFQLAWLLRPGKRGVPEIEQRRLSATALRRFSLVAATSLVALLATGFFNALIEVSSWPSLVDTTYGRLLTVKLLLLLPLLTLAGVNAFVLRPRFVARAESDGELERLRKTLAVLVPLEATIAVFVLVVTSALAQHTPSRVEAEAEANARAVAGAAPFESMANTTADVDVSLSVSPNVVGTNRFRVRLTPATAEPIDEVKSVTITLQPLLASGKEQTFQLAQDGPASYSATGDWLAEPGRWLARVEATRARRDQVRAAFAFGVQGLAISQARGPLAFPLSTGNWGTVAGGALVALGSIVWIWRGQAPVRPGLRRATAITGIALPALGVLVFGFGAVAGPAPSAPFVAQLALRYEAGDGRSVLWEADPLQVGENRFRVTVLNKQHEPERPREIEMRIMRLDREEPALMPPLRQDGASEAYLAEGALPEPGWWSIDIVLDREQVVRFYFRLDDPSPGPLAVTPPDYQSDPAAAAFFRRALAQYADLNSVRWREEVTGGVLAPTGIAGRVVVDGEGRAPDRVHLVIDNERSAKSELYRIGHRMCRRTGEGPWECLGSPNTPAFDAEYQEGATAFRLGRREVVDGQQTRVVFFYNSLQGAWYAWWVGEDTGYLHRQVMVAPGHRMLTKFFDHNAPFTVQPPVDVGGF